MCMSLCVHVCEETCIVQMHVYFCSWIWSQECDTGCYFSDSVYLLLRQGLLLPWNLPCRPR